MLVISVKALKSSARNSRKRYLPVVYQFTIEVKI
jgi:hypothetical protein